MISDLIRVFDTVAFERNVKAAKAMTRARFGATLKADAYGFGIGRAVPVLVRNGVEDFFVQDIVEAAAVRALAPKARIYTYAGVADGQAEEFLRLGIIPVCISLEQIKYYNSVAPKGTPVAIHFDTGMNRTGLSLSDAAELKKNWTKWCGNLDVALYISHLRGPYAYGDYSARQLARFKEVLAMLPKAQVSLAGSAGLKMGAEYHFDLVRLGEGLFVRGAECVASVYARVLQIRDVAKGSTVGYSNQFVAPSDMKVATLCVGYKDGYSRDLSRVNGWKNSLRARLGVGGAATKAFADFGGVLAPLVGIVSMNNAMFDVSAVPVSVLARVKYAEILGARVKVSDMRTAIGYAPVENFVGLLRYNPSAVDLTPEDFKKNKILI
ncbi:MAG: alanine racemase [Alphaproteobacteria bacterium]|nr:alanine racemase [Alphaproteobacteria bacterium]